MKNHYYHCFLLESSKNWHIQNELGKIDYPFPSAPTHIKVKSKLKVIVLQKSKLDLLIRSSPTSQLENLILATKRNWRRIQK